MILMTTKQSKAAALLVLALVIALVIGAIALPVWLLNRRYDAAIEDSVTRLTRYSRIVGMRDGLQKNAAVLVALEQNHHFLKSASPALAAAELQERAKSIIDRNGVKTNSIQIMPHKDDGMYRQVSVMFQLAAPLSAIKAMLYELESARPYLFISNLAIRNPAYAPHRGESAVEQELAIQFVLTGFALKGAQ